MSTDPLARTRLLEQAAEAAHEVASALTFGDDIDQAPRRRMAARAKAAHAKGLRVVGENGEPRWKRGALGGNGDSPLAADVKAFNLCGHVVDHDPALLDQIIAGATADGEGRR